MESQSPLGPGDLVAGKYRVEGVLGVGGMGVVVAATHLQLRELVAIKVLRPDVRFERGDGFARFVREARVAAKIRSEHVARVYDVGTLESGGAYMVLEYLEGQDLEAWLADSGKLPIDRAVEYVLQACEALAEAHAAGVVHRDLKPGNLFLASRADGSPCIKVLDFGISKVRGLSLGVTARAVDGPITTETVGAMGSPPYLAPEQLSGGDVDARADIWALGATLYELLTGITPFHGATLEALYTKILRVNPPRLSTLRPDAPAGLEAIVNRCLRKDPAHRFADVGGLAAALARFGPAVSSARSAERAARVLETAGVASSRPPAGGVLPEVDALLSVPRRSSSPPITRDASEPDAEPEADPEDEHRSRERAARRHAALGALATLGALAVILGAAVARRPIPARIAAASSLFPTIARMHIRVPEPPAFSPGLASSAAPTSSAPRPQLTRPAATSRPAEDPLFRDRK